MNTGVLHFISNSPLDGGISKKILNNSPLIKNRRIKNQNNQLYPNTSRG